MRSRLLQEAGSKHGGERVTSGQPSDGAGYVRAMAARSLPPFFVEAVIMSGMGRSLLLIATGVAVVIFFASVAQADETMSGIHYGLSGVISKIQSGVLFVKTPTSLQLRAISPNKADRVGLHEANTGDAVLLLVDSGNVLLDVTKAGRPLADHRMIVGTLHYADPYWGEIQLSTPDGFERFEVDTLAGSKLSVFREGFEVTVELDADNVMIDIHRSR